ncbi:carbohydrate sulfotransferase 11-like [Glandiceps talaboti]
MKIPRRYLGLVFICVVVVVIVLEFKGTSILKYFPAAALISRRFPSINILAKTHPSLNDSDSDVNSDTIKPIIVSTKITLLPNEEEEKTTLLPNDQDLIQRKRRSKMKTTCASMKLNSEFYHSPTYQDHNKMIYNDDYKFLYCPIPKTGGTSWRRVILVLEGVYNSTEGLHHKVVQHKHRYPTLLKLSPKQKENRLEKYTKFLFVRQPFQRLLSAYKNKLEHPDSNVFRERYGSKIVSKYRTKSTTTRGTDYQTPSFSEFVKYLIDPVNQNSFDRHWDFMHKLCSVCEYSYDYIGHFENLRDEADTIIHQLAGNNYSYPTYSTHVTNSSDEEIYRKYYSQISNEDIVKLYNVYKMDFDLFGYHFPKELLDVDKA